VTPAPTHPRKPNAGAYARGCRCAECTEAHRLRMRQVRAALRARPRDEVPHGLYGYTNWGCRCDVCGAAHSESQAVRNARRKQAAGRPLSAMEAAALARARAEGAAA
jgi:hypothetical protein